MKEKGGVDMVEGGYICGTPVGGRGIPDPLGPNSLNINIFILLIKFHLYSDLTSRNKSEHL